MICGSNFVVCVFLRLVLRMNLGVARRFGVVVGGVAVVCDLCLGMGGGGLEGSQMRSCVDAHSFPSGGSSRILCWFFVVGRELERSAGSRRVIFRELYVFVAILAPKGF
ncbi:hypothetical protein M758_3G103500 [Ceratodon purpureus]|uniref:Uncharacterized protein n=1 Tax=Ceratodon purpureus TaxID=3225 RepID=A0A8T0IGT5_CERPU|nr:hypothetical protein KC19_3G100500 [Ceratodon purpureus]KAG0622525.1 hypothetical protein M758_3G103500 [Ceratodon purpureus]